jgi:hypothetical protein
MSDLKKLIGIIPKILFALMLVLALLNVTSCEDMLGGWGGSGGGTKPSNPDDGNTQTTTPSSPPTYENFNRGDYVIVNETVRPDSEMEFLKDLIWRVYAIKEHVGDWAANYVKTNKVKTIISTAYDADAWIDPEKLDGFYFNPDRPKSMLQSYEKEDDFYKNVVHEQVFKLFTHETMHLVQYKGDVFRSMAGMRPDICAAFDMMSEFIPWFYTDTRYSDDYVIAVSMENAVERQSKYMELATDPNRYETERAKDPSLPYFLFSSQWFNNYLAHYAKHAFVVGWSGSSP